MAILRALCVVALALVGALVLFPHGKAILLFLVFLIPVLALLALGLGVAALIRRVRR